MNNASAFSEPRFLDFSRRSAKPERMDDLSSSEVRLRATLRQFTLINHLFSGTRAQFCRFLFPDILASGLRRVTILDVGAGGGDFARWCASFLKRHNVVPKIICLDYDSRVIDHLRDSCAAFPEIEVVHASLFQMDAVPGSVDYVVSTHVFHHFEDARIPQALKLLYAKARRGILVIDLERNPWAYFAFLLFSACFFHGGFTRYDGLISIRKGFTEEDVRGYSDAAGLNGLIKVRRAAIWHIVFFGIKPKS